MFGRDLSAKGISWEREAVGVRKLKYCNKILQNLSTQKKPIIYSVPIFSFIVFLFLLVYLSPQELCGASYGRLYEPKVKSKHVNLELYTSWTFYINYIFNESKSITGLEWP